jgi:predicted transcriptional regulator
MKKYFLTGMIILFIGAGALPINSENNGDNIRIYVARVGNTFNSYGYNDIIVNLTLSYLPSLLLFDQDFLEDEDGEYEWAIYIDLDNNSFTGSTWPVEGFEVSISLTNFKIPDTSQHYEDILVGTQHNTWIFNATDECWDYGHEINASIDYSNNTIMMTASTAWEEFWDLDVTDRFCFYTFYYSVSGPIEDFAFFSNEGTNITDSLLDEIYNFIDILHGSLGNRQINDQPDIDNEDQEKIPINEIVIVTSAAGSVVLLGFLATEWGKYKFFSFLPLLGPLYLRTVKEEVFDNEKRLTMYNHIADNQPVIYTELKKRCNLSHGEIYWHAHIMTQLDLIRMEKKGFHLFFRTFGKRLPPEEFIRLTDLQQSIFDSVSKNPGVTQSDLVEILGIVQQKISYNLNKLEKDGKIRVEKIGIIKHYYPL